MENGKKLLLKISAVIMIFTLLACLMSSCTSKDDTEEITRGTDAIEKPQVTEADATAVSGEATTSGAETTTSLLGDLGSLTTSVDINNAVAAQSGASGSVDPAFLAGAVRAMGFEYDPQQAIFYTGLDNWQRNANYVGHYDTFAQYGNMRYKTTTVDVFDVDGLDWRIQMWKGQYGIFGGCEVGVYTKDPVQNEMLYNCADNEHLLYMSSEMYATKEDYENGKVYFTRAWQAHWWLTGFKFGTVDPNETVIKIRIRMLSGGMAEKFEEALKSRGFYKGDASTQYDSYKRMFNDFTILWYGVGEMNYIEQTKK